jgi:hypothetical protein
MVLFHSVSKRLRTSYCASSQMSELARTGEMRSDKSLRDEESFGYSGLHVDLVRKPLHVLLQSGSPDDSSVAVQSLFQLLSTDRTKDSRAEIASIIYQKGGIGPTLQLLEHCYAVVPESLGLLVDITALEPESRSALAHQDGVEIALNVAREVIRQAPSSCLAYVVTNDTIGLIRNLSVSDSSRHAVATEACMEFCLQCLQDDRGSMKSNLWVNSPRTIKFACLFLSQIFFKVPGMAEILLQKGIVTKLAHVVDTFRGKERNQIAIHQEAKSLLNHCVGAM